MKGSALLAIGTLALIGAGETVARDFGYQPPKVWAPAASRSGNNRREESAKRHAKAKAAYKSKRAQRKASKR